MRDIDSLRCERNGGSRNGENPGVPSIGQSVHELNLIGTDAQLFSGDHVQTEQLGIKECWRTSAGNDSACIDDFDVPERSCELAINLRINEFAHDVSRFVVDHWVPNCSAVLDPMKIDWTMSGKGSKIVGPAIVLIHEASGVIGNDECGIATRAVSD
ncbi:unannotated protein [freshwater metagenome]|uniref:Unannotated protein n=1 Tax=freshwater metagenome TaxID=449393 RepID=A0A6J6ASY2_9ZZZZ